MDLPDDTVHHIFEYLTSKDWCNLIMKASNREVHLWCKTPYFLKAVTWNINVNTLTEMNFSKNDSPCITVLGNIEKMVLYKPKKGIFDVGPNKLSKKLIRLIRLDPYILGSILVKYCYENLKYLTIIDCSVRMTHPLLDHFKQNAIKLEHSIRSLKLKNADLSLYFGEQDKLNFGKSNERNSPLPNLKKLCVDFKSWDSARSFFIPHPKNENQERKMIVQICPLVWEDMTPRLWSSFTTDLVDFGRSERIDRIYLDRSYLDFDKKNYWKDPFTFYSLISVLMQNRRIEISNVKRIPSSNLCETTFIDQNSIFIE